MGSLVLAQRLSLRIKRTSAVPVKSESWPRENLLSATAQVEVLSRDSIHAEGEVFCRFCGRWLCFREEERKGKGKEKVLVNFVQSEIAFCCLVVVSNGRANQSTIKRRANQFARKVNKAHKSKIGLSLR